MHFVLKLNLIVSCQFYMVDWNVTECLINYAVVPRGECGFSEKAFFAQGADHGGFRALIVYNREGERPIDMAGGKHADDVISVIYVLSSTSVFILRL